MTCAKKQVACVIVTMDGARFTGANACDAPQEACPRAPGEGYEKCKSVCRQRGHAEEMAMWNAREAGAALEGARIYLTGIDHYCKLCQQMLFRAGVRGLFFGEADHGA